MKDKTREELRAYLKSKSVLLVTESSTDRTAWKKLFSELGVAISNFYNSSLIPEAIDIINSKRVDIVFCSYMIGDQVCYPLIEAHIEKYTDRADYFCYIVSEKNSLAVAATAVECDVDGVLIKPYNQQDLQDTITNSLVQSMNISERGRTYHRILSDIRSDKLEDAATSIESFIEQKPDSPNGYFLKGLTKKKLGELEAAIESWQVGLTKDNKHHKIICSIFDTYIELKEYRNSYGVAEVLTAGFPVNPTRIPNLIRSSLATENFHNLINFCEMITGVDDDLSFIQKPIAAALAICGKKLLDIDKESNSQLVIKSSKKAISLALPQSNVFITALQNLMALEQFEVVTEYIDVIPSDELSVEMLSLELEVNSKTQEPAVVFAKAQGLVKLNKVTPQVYCVLLKMGTKIGKSSSQLEDIFFECSKKYPEYKDDFKSLLD